MIIIRQSETIAVCELIDKPVEWVGGKVSAYRHPRAICQIENLEALESQLKIFS